MIDTKIFISLNLWLYVSMNTIDMVPRYIPSILSELTYTKFNVGRKWINKSIKKGEEKKNTRCLILFFTIMSSISAGFSFQPKTKMSGGEH